MDGGTIQTSEMGREKISHIRRHWPLIILLIVSAAVLLPRLSVAPLWQDEAETALLARSIAENGVPLVWDGRNIVTQLNGNESLPSGLWTFTPWFPLYLVAASFKMLGESEFAGRLPFVIIGIMTVAALYLLAWRFASSRAVAVLACVFFMFNVQSILYIRQCKYYSLSFLIPTLLVYLLPNLCAGRMKIFLFVVLSVIFFHTNYVSFFTLFAGFGLYIVFIKKDLLLTKNFFFGVLLILFFTIPFLVLTYSGAATDVASLPTAKSFFDKLGRHIWYFNNSVFPIILFIPLFVTKIFKQPINYFLVIIFSSWCTLAFLNQDVFRYNLALVPIFCVLLAMLIFAAYRRSPALGVALMIVLFATNLLSVFPWTIAKIALKGSDIRFVDYAAQVAQKLGKKEDAVAGYFGQIDKEVSTVSLKNIFLHDVLKVEYAAYYNQLFGEYNEPLAAVLNVLRRHAAGDDVIVTNFGQLPLQFYTDYKTGYLVDMSGQKAPKTFEMPSYVYDLLKTGWYVPRKTKLLKGPFITEQDIFKFVRANNLRYEIFDTGINELYWDGAWPLYFERYKNKFFFHEPPTDETIKVVRIRP